jgi:hypothetical protein
VEKGKRAGTERPGDQHAVHRAVSDLGAERLGSSSTWIALVVVEDTEND